MAEPTRARTDADIHSDLLGELKREPRVQPNEIGVVVWKGVVTLTGLVDSFANKWAAEEATRRVRGVKAVANDIEVRLTSDRERTDAEIAGAVVRSLDDAAIPNEKLEVTVSKGWVTLSGEVEWQYQKEDGERVVRRLAGITGVMNLITVVPAVAASGITEDDRGGVGSFPK